MSDTPTCGARTTFWPDVEAIDAECILPRGHWPTEIHEDDALGGWDEDELPTVRPESEDAPPTPEERP